MAGPVFLPEIPSFPRLPQIGAASAIFEANSQAFSFKGLSLLSLIEKQD
jgi:hypothetical protein